MSPKGFTNSLIIGIIALAVLVLGISGYLIFVKKPEQVVEKQTPIPTPISTSTPTPTPMFTSASTPTPTLTPTPAERLVDFPRIIRCNPRRYDPEYFKQYKPCEIDMTAQDIERENKAISIIEKAALRDISLKAIATYPTLLVSDKRYQMIETAGIGPRAAFIIVDTVEGKVTDYFVPKGYIEPKVALVNSSVTRFIFLDELPSTQPGITAGFFVRQYTFGKEKAISLRGTEVYLPLDYRCSEGPMEGGDIKVIASSTNTITLAVCDRNSPLPQKPGDDFVKFKQVGTKVINLLSE
jgi:hypothetical protein